MEGVAARLGRSSTRYGPAAVFSGPVRRWNKKWVPLSNPDNRRRSSNGGLPHSSHLLLYRWTPASSPTDGAVSASKDAATPQPEEPPRRKFRYVPISIIDERKEEYSPKSNDIIKPNEADQFPHIGQIDPSATNPDMNNVSAEEAQASYKDQTSSDEGNGGAELDLSLGLRAPEGDHEDELKTLKQGESSIKLVKASSNQDTEKRSVSKPVAQNRLKRKAATPDLEMRV
ncbi:hypothetical protein Cni_G09181 [Canna indica]|uniref:Uncharacterized protein n=1 Tax=Canna indica TaxID=4628 RepID=A0AAQ3K207_9LILI|nr:hypothetical protein Cni_G09181 [Canna indica]